MDSHGPTLDPASPLQRARVMLVDDDPLICEVVQVRLAEQGFADVVATHDPTEALDMLRREQPELLLLDLVMPRMSGFELLGAIRADEATRWLPVIVLTADTSAQAKLQALQLGATDFLAKPVDESELALRVRNALAYKAYNDRMIHADAVTGLPNWRSMQRTLQAQLAGAESGQAPALLGVWVPECGQLRQSLGAASADALARVLAGRMERLALAWSADRAARQDPRWRVTAARIDDDGFALVVPQATDPRRLEQRGKDLLATLGAPVRLGEHEVVPSPCVGIAMAPLDGQDAEALSHSARRAVDHARQGAGSGRLAFASAEINERARQRMTLGLQLRGAARRGELRLRYQPKVGLRSGRIAGAEALLAWEHPELGHVSPQVFIGLAEEHGLIEDIGAWVLERACRDAVAWGPDGPGVAVNVSQAQFMAGSLHGIVQQALAATELPPGRLTLELTESMLMQRADEQLGRMHELKALGVRISIDDFGTGYSSLSYLRQLPAHELKIDRSFVMDMPHSATDRAIVQTIIDLGHRLGMSLVAEGIESEAQLACLRATGCDLVQGFLFSRAVASEEFKALSAQPGRMATQADVGAADAA